MYTDTVECPYCRFENDMTNGLVDLPDNHKFDHICENESCRKLFEVYVEFIPTYTSAKIDEIPCEKCGSKTRDVYRKRRTFPYPSHLKEESICKKCYFTEMYKEMYREENEDA